MPLEYTHFGRWVEIQDSICGACRSPLETKVHLGNTSRVIIFSLLIADQFYVKINSLQLSSVPQTELSFGNKKYVLSSAIFHHGTELKGGHYTVILRKNGNFFRANDGTIEQCSWPRNSKDLYYLFYVEK